MTTSPTPDPAATILIVEHDEITTMTYARILRLTGYEVRTALSALDGLRDVESSRPDAIILDFRMPDLDGLEFLRRLRSRAASRTIPVGLVTGDYFLDETVPVQLNALGARIWFKPLSLDDLVTAVRTLLTEPQLPS